MTEVPSKNLSFLSMKTILGYMNPEKVFEVSIESESFNNLVETIKAPLRKIILNVGERSVNFVNCYGCNYRKFKFQRTQPQQRVDRVVKARINGKPMTLHETIGRTYIFGDNYYCTEIFSLVEMEDIYIHLMRLFDLKKLRVWLDLSPSTINCFAWKIPLNTIDITCTSECRITWEVLKQVVENEAVASVNIEFNYSYCRENILSYDERIARDSEVLRQTRASLLVIPKMIKCEELRCREFDFFSVDDLINSRCKRIFLTNQVNQLTNSEVNKLLKTWQKGECMTKLERFSIKNFTKNYKRTLEIIEGIELHNEKPTHPIYIEEYSEKIDRFENRGGLVVKRETDNTLATVMINDNGFEFVVWKDKQNSTN